MSHARPPAAVLAIARARSHLASVDPTDLPTAALSALALILESAEHVVHAMGTQPEAHSPLKAGEVRLILDCSPSVCLSLDAACVRMRKPRAEVLATALDLLRDSQVRPSSAPPAPAVEHVERDPFQAYGRGGLGGPGGPPIASTTYHVGRVDLKRGGSR